MTIVIKTRAWCRLAGLSLAVVAPAVAQAQAYPTIEPQRPVSITYDFSSSESGPLQVEAFVDPTRQVARLQLGQSSMYLLVDRANEQVMLVSPDKRLIFVVPTGGMLHRKLGPDSGLRFTRAGHRLVAGEGCTVWSLVGPDGSGDACITDDGVILEGTGQSNHADDHGHLPSGHLLARTVSYGPLAPSLFAPPPGLQEVDLPPSMVHTIVPGLVGSPNQ